MLPALFLPGPLVAEPGTLHELEDAETANLDDVAEVIPE